MPSQVLEYRCLLISPSDVDIDRDGLTKTVNEWNAQVGKGLGVRVELVRWESHGTPDASGPPQAILNRQIVDECELGIAIFWTTPGSTPTEDHESGSIEEIRRLQDRRARVLLYFCGKPVPQEALRDDRYRRLDDFRKLMEKESFFFKYQDTADLQRQVSLHLTSVVLELIRQDRASDVVQTPQSTPASSAEVRTATKPDVRVIMNPGLVPVARGHVLKFLVVTVQNHSPSRVFIRSVYLKLRGDRRLQVGVDALTGALNQRRALESGESFEFNFSPTDIVAQVPTEDLLSAAVRDDIGREYESAGGDVLKRIMDLLLGDRGASVERSPEEAELLVAAVKAGGVLTRLSMDQLGSWVRAGNSGRNFVDAKDRMVAKRYLEALDRLVSSGLVKERSPVWFELTSEGERVAEGVVRDELPPQWETDARAAVIDLLDSAEWDSEKKRVRLASKLEADGGASFEEFDSYDSLMRALSEAAEVAWHGSVPYENGEAVVRLDDDAWVRGIAEAHAGDELRKMGWIESHRPPTTADSF